MKIISIITGGRPLLDIEYKYSYMNVLGFIYTEGAESTEPGDHYLSRLPEIYSNFSVRPVVLHRLLGIYFNACTTIDNPNSMQQYDIVLEKYWVTQSGYFILATTVALGMGIIDGKLL